MNNKEYLAAQQRTYRKSLKYKLWVKQHCKTRNDKYKLLMHELKINGCAICGYDKCDEALEFHHGNPENKKLRLNLGTLSRRDELIVEELNKCTLLCANCHREIHANNLG